MEAAGLIDRQIINAGSLGELEDQVIRAMYDGWKAVPDGKWRQGPVACAICCHKWTAVRPDGVNSGMECPKCHAMAGFEVEP